MIHISIDSKSLYKLQQLQNWKPVLDGHLFIAMDDALLYVEERAQKLMDQRFENPTGALADNFDQGITVFRSGIEGDLWNDSPYAWRREEGFSGMTDSAGRYFPYDPGIHYANDALAQSQQWVVKRFKKAINEALDDLT